MGLSPWVSEQAHPAVEDIFDAKPLRRKGAQRSEAGSRKGHSSLCSQCLSGSNCLGLLPRRDVIHVPCCSMSAHGFTTE